MRYWIFFRLLNEPEWRPSCNTLSLREARGYVGAVDCGSVRYCILGPATKEEVDRQGYRTSYHDDE